MAGREEDKAEDFARLADGPVFGLRDESRLIDPAEIGGDTLSGGAGDDFLRGGAGGDDMTGAAGRDTLIGGAGDDEIWAGGLVDIGPAAAPFADPTADLDRIFAGAGNDLVVGDGGRDVARGGAGNDELIGRGGDDRLFGGFGADELRGMAGDDTLRGGANGDRLRGGAGEDRLSGAAGRDRLFGGADDDRIQGGAGGDRIVGGAGDDSLTGGAGPDRFVFTNASSIDDDLVTDFTRGEDRVVFRDVASATGLADLRIEAAGDGAVIHCGDGTVTLADVDAALLTTEDFVF